MNMNVRVHGRTPLDFPLTVHTQPRGIHEKETNISSSTQAFFTSPEEMPLFTALLFVLKTYLLVCVCACKVYMQKKKIKMQRSSLERLILGLSLCHCGPQRKLTLGAC